MGAIVRKKNEFTFRCWELSSSYTVKSRFQNIQIRIEKKGNKIFRVNSLGKEFPTNFLLFNSFTSASVNNNNKTFFPYYLIQRKGGIKSL